MPQLCTDCKQVLTEEEIKYYEARCEKCESEWTEEMYQWRHGEENKELDKLYENQKKY